MMKRFALALGLSMFTAIPATAANIIWDAPVDGNGNPSQVINLGGIFAAATDGPDTTVNGVSFVGSTSFSGGVVSFGSQPVTVSGLSNNNEHYGSSAPVSWDAAYAALVNKGGYHSTPSPVTIDISGLSVGKQYLVQIFEPFWDKDWATSYTGGANTSAPVNLAASVTGTPIVPQFVTGRFVADATTQTIGLSSLTNYVVFDAISIQAVPEPISWAMFLGGFGLIGAAVRRTREHGQLV